MSGRRSRVLPLLLLLGATCQSQCVVEEREDPSAESPTPTPPPDRPPPPARPGNPDVLEATLDVVDPQHVELLDVVRQSAALARRLESEAELTGIRGDELRTGTLDLRSARNPLASVTFHFLRRDPTRPPGQDVTEGHVEVWLTGTTLTARRSETSDPLFKILGPLPVPECTLRAAWTAVVESGVPADAIAGARTWRTPSQREPVWLFAVEGHDEYRREIAMKTCAAPKPPPKVTSAAKATPLPRPRPPIIVIRSP